MVCKTCGKEFFEDWRKDKNVRKTECNFCCNSCANKRTLTKESKEKISESLKKFHKNNIKKGIKRNREKSIRYSSFDRNLDKISLLSLSKRTISKILRRLDIGCCVCGWKEDICDIHHIKPRKEGGTDDSSNLTYLCPNCHRLIGNGKLDITKIISLDIYIGERWKEFYYVKGNKNK